MGAVKPAWVLFFIFVFCLLFILPDQVFADTVGTSTTSFAISYPFQRKAFYVNGRFWVFYSNGTRMVYSTSTDGSTWNPAVNVRVSSRGYKFSIWFNETYVYYAYSGGISGDAIVFRRGIPNSDGRITWSDEQTVLEGVSGVEYDDPFISVDSSGYVWIAYKWVDATNTYPYVTKSGNNDGTWGTTPSGFPYKLSTTSGIWDVSIIPLTSKKMFAVYALDAGTIRGRRWTGSAWGSEQTTTSSTYYSIHYSAVAQGDDVHLVFVKTEPYNIVYTKYSYTSNAWGTETTVQAGVSGESAPVLSINTTTNALYVFWINSSSPTTKTIYYKKNVGGTWDASPTDWVTETAITGNDKLTGYYKNYGEKIGLVYTVGTASPFDIRFEYLTFGIPTTTTTTTTTTSTSTTTTLPTPLSFTSFSFSTTTNQLNVNWVTEYSGISVSVSCKLNGAQNCNPYPYTGSPGGGSCTIASPSYVTTPDPSGLPRTVANQINCTAYDTGSPAVKYEKIVYFYPRAIEVSLPASMSLVVGEEQDLLITVKNNGTLSDSYGISVTSTTPNLLTVAAGSQSTQVLGTNDVQQAHVGLTLLATGQPATANVVVSSGSQPAIHFDMPVSVKGTEKSLPEFGAAGIMQIIAAAALLAIFLF